MWQQALKGRPQPSITLAGALFEFDAVGYGDPAPHLLDHSGGLEFAHDGGDRGALHTKTFRQKLMSEWQDDFIRSVTGAQDPAAQALLYTVNCIARDRLQDARLHGLGKAVYQPCDQGTCLEYRL